jgi:hypothetical protein
MKSTVSDSFEIVREVVRMGVACSTRGQSWVGPVREVYGKISDQINPQLKTPLLDQVWEELGGEL